MTKYKVVFVDWDGTLSHSRFWDRWKGTEKYDLVQNALFVDSLPLVQDWMRGIVSHEAVVKHAAELTDIPYDELVAELQYSAENMAYIEPKSLEVIQQLRNQGTKVVIATDNMDTFRKWTVPALGLEAIFDDILSSDELDGLKTDFFEDGRNKFFHRHIDQHGLLAGEAVIIDNSTDIQVVEKSGIDFLHVNAERSLYDHLRELAGQSTEP